MPNKPLSFRLSATCVRLIKNLSKVLGLKRSAVVELAIRRLAQEEKVSETEDEES